MFKNLQKNVSVISPTLVKARQKWLRLGLGLYLEFYGMLWPWNFLKYVSITQEVDWEVDNYLFLLVSLFPLYKYYIEKKNVNPRYIWRRVIPLLHSEDLFFQYRFIYFIHFSCFNSSFFILLCGKSSITHISNLLSSSMFKTVKF